mgnify:CR=1 FL=1
MNPTRERGVAGGDGATQGDRAAGRIAVVVLAAAVVAPLLGELTRRIGLSIVVMGNISPDELARFTTTAVAQAAKPVLGQVGFVVVSIGALFATASSINASFFCALEVSRGLAGKGQLPPVFERVAWGQGTRGLVWSAAGTLGSLMLFFRSSQGQNL